MAKEIGNVVTFEKSIADWIDRADDKFSDVVSGTVIRATNAIVDLSPVDTGRFKANWQVTANAPAAQSLNDYDQLGGETKSALARQARAVARSKATKVIYITNRLDYAAELEYGASNQAPSGVLGVVRARLGRYFEESVAEARSKS
ncbi:hypothetical protein MM01_00024 [Escherichia phage vB_EcoS_MM01]|uniref:HK97 gp10 family phage protein n=1 Tax=Escherichia phage vB_EcoS_MM01 TaxID=2508188 RepID=A0A482N5W7_9CAUD|nr:hypothetical protein MM01_00024 [Escherichia phage vB_EcoS_MM01]